MAVPALIIYLGWAVLAFGARSLLQWRRTGDTGFRGRGLRPGSVQWWARILFSAALITGAAGPLAGLAGLEPISALDRPIVSVAGTAVAVAGVAATLAAQASMGASWRIGVDESERTALVTTGAFALARNPIFTAMIITAAGLAAMVPNPVTVSGLALTVLAIQVQVRVVEEPYLQQLHGQAYLRYTARVGRFVPGVGRLDPATGEGRAGARDGDDGLVRRPEESVRDSLAGAPAVDLVEGLGAEVAQGRDDEAGGELAGGQGVEA